MGEQIAVALSDNCAFLESSLPQKRAVTWQRRKKRGDETRPDSKPRKLCLKSGCMTGKMKLPAFDLSFSFHIKNLKFHLKIKIRKRLEVCS